MSEWIAWYTSADARSPFARSCVCTRAAKKQRTALQSAFTGGDGPGSRVRASFNDVMAKLHFPAGPQREAAKTAAQALPVSRLQEAWSDGKYYLLPSFMELLAYLAAESSSSSAYEFKLVFRTFGDDIPEVAKELELLVNGAHPYAVGQPPLPRAFLLNVAPGSNAVGTFYRDGYDASGTALAVGTLTKLPFSSANQSDARALETFYSSSNVNIARGFDAVDKTIDAMLKDHATVALRDYWEWWSAHAENGEYGKLLLVHEDVENVENAPLAIFFDDHIEAHHAHIVDVRDVATGAAVPFDTSAHKYLQRVEPFAAITDSQYFIKLVQDILRRPSDAKL